MSVSSHVETERGTALQHVYRLIHDLQAGDADASDTLESVIQHCEDKGWDDVVRAGVFGRAVRSWFTRDGATAEHLEDLIRRSTDAGDNIMLALGLALRSDQGFSGSSPLRAELREADLARAVVLLEQSEGGPLERVSAHTAVAIAFGNRWLFELADDQYAAAIAVGEARPDQDLDLVLVAVMFNLAEAVVSWASMLRQLGDNEAVAERWRSWKAASAAVASYDVAATWADELAALGLLLDAIAGRDVALAAVQRLQQETITTPGGVRTGGLLQLAAALSNATARRPGALEMAELAIGSIDEELSPHVYDLALCVAAELEDGGAGTAGLRYARRQLEESWTHRLASLGAMRTRIHAERMAAERELLTRHARLDDLTGIGNRRALDRYRADLERRDAETMAIILVDVNAFKEVNDRYGHLAGDRVLIRIASVLDAAIRPSDLAVRLGGDEFAVILADTDADVAMGRAVQMLIGFDEQSYEDIHPDLEVTVSAGVASGAPAAMSTVFGDADKALYAAKAGRGIFLGRNRLVRTEA